MLRARVIQKPDFPAIKKQIAFGTAKGLTDTAKDAQKAVVDALQSTFTLRGNWFRQNMRHGIKITPAKRDKLQSAVHTLADWLEPHETGKDKTPRGSNIAVPTENVRRNKRMIIPKGQRPKGLGDKVFVMQTKRGPVLAQRITRGKNKGIRILYGLEKKVAIKKNSTFYEPAEKTVKANLKKNIDAGIRYALATAK